MELVTTSVEEESTNNKTWQMFWTSSDISRLGPEHTWNMEVRYWQDQTRGRI